MIKASLILPLMISSAIAEPGILDLTQLYNYAEQPVPAYITKDNTLATNPITDLGATLGRVLFYDTRLSRNGTVSCASCHQQEHAFGDPAQASTGVAGTTGRHSMRLINARFSAERRFFWDERANTLEVQTTQPIQDHVEMGFSGNDGDPALSDLVERLEVVELYHVLFTGVYGDPAITEDRIQEALAQFVRSIQSFDSKYDEGRINAPNDNAPFTNFTAEENEGKRIFMTPPPAGGAGCAACHQAPEFDIDPRSGNNGVVGSLGGGTDFTNTRSPSLRDLLDADGSPHGPFMHDGSLGTIGAVINHYSGIPVNNTGLDPRLRPGGQPQRLNLSAQDRAALGAFLQTLTGSAVYRDEKWSSPFDEGGNLSMVMLPAEVSIDKVSSVMRLTCRGVPNVTYLLKQSTDLKSWSEGIQVTADATGMLSYELTQNNESAFYLYVYQSSL